MSNRFDIDKYGFGSFDDYFCLRPSRMLIASLIFLCRSVIAVVAFGLGGDGAEQLLGGIVDPEANWAGVLAAAPALLVLYALVARVPRAPSFVQWTWKHGRLLVALSALCHIGIAAVYYSSDPRHWHGLSALDAAVALADLAIVVYVFSSSRVRQTFADFPSA
jgi:hypothetical protein